jgi:hypothetical protein
VTNSFGRITCSGCLVAGCLALGLTTQVNRANAQVLGSWTSVIELQNNPVAVALLNNGQILTWSSNNQFVGETDIGSAPGQTYTSLFDPVTTRSVLRLVTGTLSDMFCPGTAMLPDGRVLVNGGASSPNANVYDPAYNSWTAEATMNVPRGYNADVMLTDGSVLTLGGSWSGAHVDKIGEVWSSATGWTERPGISAEPITGPDPQDAADGYIYRGDNHAWLFAVSRGLVFHAGPSAEMHWITTDGDGSIVSAGNRADDNYSINGQAVMYDIGKILKTGGAPGYQDAYATANTYVIDINSAIADQNNPVVVRETAPMAYPRAFANGVALPNGQVLVVGGQTYAVPYSDENAVLVPELWDPTTETFTQLAPMQTPRTYHSTAVLLPDARVFVGGGGLGGDCGTNHAATEIFSPPYLFNPDGSAAARPHITSAPTAAPLGTTVSVTTDTSTLTFALIRMSAVTHTVSNDQRRIPLGTQTNLDNTYSLTIPSDPGVAPPGYYMLFAINTQGTPSVASVIQIE